VAGILAILFELYWSPTISITKALIDESFSFRSSDYGLIAPESGTEEEIKRPQTLLNNLLKWHDQEKFLNTLSKSERPDFDKLDFPATERANVFSHWYAVQLMKLHPVLFARSPESLSDPNPPFVIDIYDALHSTIILFGYYKAIGKKDFRTKKHSNVTVKLPIAGVFGLGGTEQSGTSVVPRHALQSGNM
jgi:hypothetical protein